MADGCVSLVAAVGRDRFPDPPEGEPDVQQVSGDGPAESQRGDRKGRRGGRQGVLHRAGPPAHTLLTMTPVTGR